MLGLLLLYYIGKTYYELADRYAKNKWLFAFLGIFSYYFGIIFVAIFVGLLAGIFDWFFLDEMNDFLLDLMLMPFGLLSCGGMYYFFKRTWREKKEEEEENLRTMLNDIGENQVDPL